MDDSLVRTAGNPTGRAVIVVGADHENRIILLGGANATVTALLPAERAALARADALLLQLELPQSVVTEAAAVARDAGALVALTPAPVQPLEPDLLASTTLLFVNEHECAALTSEKEIDRGIGALLDLVPSVVVTRGALGSDYGDRSGRRHHRPAERVIPVDTTAAGDVYAGVFTATCVAGLAVEEAMVRATRAAAIAVQRAGTSRSVPTLAEALGPAAG